MNGEKEVVIVGAGIGGLALACFLGKQGWSARVFEKRPDPASEFADGQRQEEPDKSDVIWQWHRDTPSLLPIENQR